jgi:hexulose-6-phosphate isomerase
MTRRMFAGSAALAAVAGQPRFVKGICSAIFPSKMPYAEQILRAKNAGFDAIELPMRGELGVDAPIQDVRRIGDAARKTRVAIASLWVSPPLAESPLNSPDAAVRARGLAAIRRGLEFAKYLDCGAMLVVPGRVGSGPKLEVGYETTWRLFTEELKKVVPDAERAKVLLTLENVSNRFLVSPLEMRSFVDQFRSPCLQTHFDIGNVMYFGYPQDWILTLGARIKRVHVKDRKASPQAEAARASRLLDGDVDWRAVMAALVQAGYSGFLSPEIGHDPQQPDQLASVSSALDKILAMA